MENFDRIWQLIADQFNLQALSSEEQEEVFSWLSDKITDQVNRTFAEMLGAEDSERQQRILGTEGYEASLEFLKEKIPNFHYVVHSVGMRVLKELGVNLDS